MTRWNSLFTSTLLALLLPMLSPAQNCSTASMTLVGQHSDIGAPGNCNFNSSVNGIISIKITNTFNDTCTGTADAATNANTQYFTINSAVTGNGQCQNFMTRNLACFPRMVNNFTLAAGPGDFNRFYNQAFDNAIAFNSNGSAVCKETSMHQDFQQCAGLACAGGGGSGGDCAFVPGPTGGIVTTDPSGDPPQPCNCPPGETCPGPGTGSPIIIDAEGEGFHLTSAATGVTFDIRGTGHPVQIAWTAAQFHNAFLALPGSDGLVHNGKELFGNFTPQPQSADPNGFLALELYDKPEKGGNGDGIIDERDQVFAQLRLWIDENHDGVCQPNELHRLPELGVYSLALDYKDSRRIDQFGNQFRYKARVNPGERQDSRDQRPHGEQNEVGRWTYDVFFVTK